MARTILLLAAGLVAAGCKHKPDAAEGLALALVAAARSEAGIVERQVHSELVEKVRRLQLLRRATLDTHDRPKLLEVLAGEAGPDRQYPVADRAQKQRERATRGLRASTEGTCRAIRDDRGAAERIAYLVEEIEGVPPEVRVAQQELETALHDAQGVRLECARGRIGLLFVPGEGGPRVVDIYALGHSSFEVNPNDPTMK